MMLLHARRRLRRRRPSTHPRPSDQAVTVCRFSPDRHQRLALRCALPLEGVDKPPRREQKGQSYCHGRIGPAFSSDVFYRDDEGALFHTYSTCARGLDMMNAAYQYLDLTLKGRDESEMPYSQARLCLHDEYT